jgi:hypothetical protein
VQRGSDDGWTVLSMSIDVFLNRCIFHPSFLQLPRVLPGPSMIQRSLFVRIQFRAARPLICLIRCPASVRHTLLFQVLQFLPDVAEPRYTAQPQECTSTGPPLHNAALPVSISRYRTRSIRGLPRQRYCPDDVAWWNTLL